MAEPQTATNTKFEVVIKGEKKVIEFKEPTVAEQLEFINVFNDAMSGTAGSSPKDFFTKQIEVVAKSTGLTPEEVMNMRVVDKDKVVRLLNERNFQWMRDMQDLLPK